VIIATDEDREGESIGWHLIQVLQPKVPVRRMVFHEITKEAIEEAIKNPRQIDEQLVRAQETRRILDRLVGYTVSPLLWKKIAPGLSANKKETFNWKTLNSPQGMDLDTKSLRSVTGVVGFDGKRIIHFAGRYFEFKKTNVFVGYGYISGDQRNARYNFTSDFEGDSAIGCNATAEIIFSVTKEKLSDFYCSLTGISP